MLPLGSGSLTTAETDASSGILGYRVSPTVRVTLVIEREAMSDSLAHGVLSHDLKKIFGFSQIQMKKKLMLGYFILTALSY